MNLRMALVIIVVAALSVIPAIAQDQYALQMKYTPGEQRPMHVMLTGIGTLMIQGAGAPAQPTDLWMNAQIDLSQETKSVDERGTANVELKLAAMDFEMQFMGMRQNLVFEDGQLLVMLNDQVVLDSLDAKQAEQNPMMALIGQGFIIRQDRTGKVVGLPQLELIMKAMMPDSDFRAAIEQSTGPLPPGPVKIGDTWEERQVWPYGMPEGQERPVLVTRHTLEALEPMGGHQCAKITSESKVDITDMTMTVPTMPMGQQAGGVTQLGMVMNKMVMELTGTHYFDIERGTTLKMDVALTLNLDMKQKMQIPKQPAEQQQDQEGQEAAEQEEDATAETPPEAQEMQEIEIGINIEDLTMDIAVELVQ